MENIWDILGVEEPHKPYSGVGSLTMTLFTHWTVALYQPVQQHLWIIAVAVLSIQKQHQKLFCNEDLARDHIKTALMHTHFIYI